MNMRSTGLISRPRVRKLGRQEDREDRCRISGPALACPDVKSSICISESDWDKNARIPPMEKYGSIYQTPRTSERFVCSLLATYKVVKDGQHVKWNTKRTLGTVLAQLSVPKHGRE